MKAVLNAIRRYHQFIIAILLIAATAPTKWSGCVSWVRVPVWAVFAVLLLWFTALEYRSKNKST